MDYTTVTEAPGTRFTREAAAMLYTRYRFAAAECAGRDVLEVACGAGAGLGYLASRARTVVGGDCTLPLLRGASRHYGSRIPLVQLDAQALPFRRSAFDVILLFEAVYYLRDAAAFFRECARVLRSGGTLLLVTVNCEWSGFHRSPLSTRYLGARELSRALSDEGFAVQLMGSFPITSDSRKARLVRALTRWASRLGLMPRTMAGKELLKRIFAGPLMPVPSEVGEGMANYVQPAALNGVESRRFKILYARARPRGAASESP